MKRLADITQQWVQGIQLFFREKLLWSSEWGDRPVWGPIDSPWQIIAEPAESIYRVHPRERQDEEKFRYHGSGLQHYAIPISRGSQWVKLGSNVNPVRFVGRFGTRSRNISVPIYEGLSRARDGNL